MFAVETDGAVVTDAIVSNLEVTLSAGLNKDAVDSLGFVIDDVKRLAAGGLADSLMVRVGRGTVSDDVPFVFVVVVVRVIVLDELVAAGFDTDMNPLKPEKTLGLFSESVLVAGGLNGANGYLKQKKNRILIFL